MPRRSTRDRIKAEAFKLDGQVDRAFIYLRSIQELGQDRSEVINEWLPKLFQVFSAVKTLTSEFERRL